MSLETNKAIVRRHFEELWTKGDLDVADEIYSPGAIGHCGTLPDQVDFPESEKQGVRDDLAAFPDGRATVLIQIAEGDMVLTRWLFKGTHLGPLYGIPASGNEVAVTGFHLHRLTDGKIVEVWAQGDFYGLLGQVGALPAQEAESETVG